MPSATWTKRRADRLAGRARPPRPRRPGPARRAAPSFVSNVSSAIGQLLRTRADSPAGRSRRSSTISGTAAARQATTASPAAIASANTMPEALLDGRQAEAVAPVRILGQLLARDLAEERHRVAEAQLGVQARRARRLRPLLLRCAPGRPGFASRSTAAARSRSSRRLRGYMRATASTVGGPGGPARRRAERRRHSVEVDRLRHHGQALGRHPVDLAGPPPPSSGSARRRGRRARCCAAPSAPARESSARTSPARSGARRR